MSPWSWEGEGKERGWDAQCLDSCLPLTARLGPDSSKALSVRWGLL